MSGSSLAVREELAPTGVLRVAINYGNPVLAQRDRQTGEPRGVTVDIAREIGRCLDLPMAFSTFDAAGKVFEAAASGALDLMFLAIDPVRAAQILFTAPYVIIEGTYIVRDDCAFRRIEEFDGPGVRIAVGKGAAYDLFLSRELKQALLVRSATSGAAVDLFVKDSLEAAAGVRQPLLAYAAAHAGFRVIDESFTAISQAVGTPTGREVSRDWLHDLVEQLKASGFIRDALQRSDQRDAVVAPACG
ncbi:MAG: transporter substrate-binding domain-containing protein [Steroidobacteraceae bacterium]